MGGRPGAGYGGGAHGVGFVKEEYSDGINNKIVLRISIISAHGELAVDI